jgi:hypothetical protein
VSRKTEPPPAAADGGSSRLGEPSIFEPAKIAAAAIRRTAELGVGNIFYARRRLGNAIISARQDRISLARAAMSGACINTLHIHFLASQFQLPSNKLASRCEICGR